MGLKDEDRRRVISVGLPTVLGRRRPKVPYGNLFPCFHAVVGLWQRKEWLASLKTGDLVTIESGMYADTVYKVTLNYKSEPEVLGRTLSVTGILPKGRSDGIGGKIVPATAEHIAAHTARCARVKFAYGFNWREVTDEQVLAIAKILNFDPLSGGK